jgi:hypothetical protein
MPEIIQQILNKHYNVQKVTHMSENTQEVLHKTPARPKKNYPKHNVKAG